MAAGPSASVQRRQFLAAAGTSAVAAVGGCVTVSRQSASPLSADLPALDDGGRLPVRFSCDGDGVSPAVTLSSVPEPTASVMVTATVTSNIANQSLLWTLWNVPPETERIPEDLPREPTVGSLDGARQGRVRLGEVGYRAPCPPPGETYDYDFQIYALDRRLDIDGGTTNEDAVEATEGRVLASTRTTVSYARAGDVTPLEGPG
ncbi:YbhB/YbcL family Raf kinase inhibitor-like protein [Halapricum sp. CBA1109]|uniref:YbhB/YbcL family Raf kinase inhibitor-like protein n=1 Tax=Halapricum sp. CBA1109 TaxID=2668068 RepID=UPI0018D23AF6